MESKREIFLNIIEQHKGIIYKIANSYCKHNEDRKDLVQEIILQLWLSFDDYNSNYKYSTWIYRIALNISISFYRKQSKRKEKEEDFSQILEHKAEYLKSDEEDHQIILLQQFIKALKEMDRALILLYLDGLSQKEISSIMGISPSNISTKIHRIKSTLKNKFLNHKKEENERQRIK